MYLLPTTNTYSETKVISERILMDEAKANPNFEQKPNAYGYYIGTLAV